MSKLVRNIFRYFISTKEERIIHRNFYNIDELGNPILGENSTEKNSHVRLRINHYASKSIEEAEERAYCKFGGSNLKRKSHDINNIKDFIVEPYVRQRRDERLESYE